MAASKVAAGKKVYLGCTKEIDKSACKPTDYLTKIPQKVDINDIKEDEAFLCVSNEACEQVQRMETKLNELLKEKQEREIKEKEGIFYTTMSDYIGYLMDEVIIQLNRQKPFYKTEAIRSFSQFNKWLVHEDWQIQKRAENDLDEAKKTALGKLYTEWETLREIKSNRNANSHITITDVKARQDLKAIRAGNLVLDEYKPQVMTDVINKVVEIMKTRNPEHGGNSKSKLKRTRSTQGTTDGKKK